MSDWGGPVWMQGEEGFHPLRVCPRCHAVVIDMTTRDGAKTTQAHEDWHEENER